MRQVNIDIRFEGKNFFPTKLKQITGLPLEILAEYGEIANIGRYKGEPSPYGLALLKIERNKNDRDLTKSFNKSLEKLIALKNSLSKTGLENIIIDIDAPALSESEFSLGSESLQKITQLNARVDLHTMPEEEYMPLISDVRVYIESIIKSETFSIELENKLNQSDFETFFSSFLKNYTMENKLALRLYLNYILKYWKSEKQQLSFKETLKKIN